MARKTKPFDRSPKASYKGENRYARSAIRQWDEFDTKRIIKIIKGQIQLGKKPGNKRCLIYAAAWIAALEVKFGITYSEIGD